ncbi:SDR family NAD(P)-dependent oxidoreductase [Novosphingobium malaysiense]|uniref:Short-chain dehydrogenase n=1 Tax=Novosphingobium malaysiense TaxID=1348853 RepID=A0A0B1ZT81_9SPHN|nr:SDR family NAD(P)-dependent oxidoreductase [Novosphingobium malaysiense]KHK92649.1 short-chain dehydrogenase [Novosphingobium malaysiense]
MAVRDVSALPLTELISLKGRNAVITGAAWGLGRATAFRLAEAGASVLIGDVDTDKAKATAADISLATGARVLSTYSDAGDSASVVGLVDHAIKQFGNIDIWVNNAGLPSSVPVFDLSEEEFDRVVAITLKGTFLGAREAARRMVEAGRGGTIVNVASLAGLLGISPGQSAYVAAKHGVVGLTKTMAIELGKHDIRVMAVAPGVCLTEKTAFLADLPPEKLKAIGIPGIDTSRLGRVGTADDVARVILFCASDMAMFMSGCTLPVDGGIAS